MSDLQERLDRAERALTRSGFTLVEGAQEWKPPLGPSASPLLDRIDLLTKRLGASAEWLSMAVSALESTEWENPNAAHMMCDGIKNFLAGHRSAVDTALVGNLRERSDTEWTDATSAPTAEDYRELQAQHDQVQSRLKAALDMLREMLGYVDGPKWQALIDERKAHDWLGRIEALLAGQVPDHTWHPLAMVPAGWQLVPVEPAFAMLAADGCKEHHEGQECIHHKNRRRIWKAMLSAAPKPEGAA